MSTQPTGSQQLLQTGFSQGGQQQRPPSSFSNAGGGGGGGGGGLSFLNQPPPFSFRQGGLGVGVNPQMTGYPGGGASGLMSQQTGFTGGGFGAQPTGMGIGIGMGGGGGLMSQPTGMGGGLRPQPTGLQDPRLQSMMQSFMPSNLSQVRSSLRSLPRHRLHRLDQISDLRQIRSFLNYPFRTFLITSPHLRSSRANSLNSPSTHPVHPNSTQYPRINP